MTQVVVVGGGFGGLLVGAELKRRGADVVVLEADDHPGGVAGTVKEGGYLLEPAAGSLLLPHSAMSPILDAAAAEMVPAISHKRFVYERSTLYEAGPGAVLSRLVSWRAKFRAVREPWVKTPPEGDESLMAFFVRRLGPETGALAATLMAHGVFAGDPDQLSARAAFGKIVALEDEAGSLVRGGLARRKQRPDGVPRASVHVPRFGMSDLANRLASYLGAAYRPNWTVSGLSPVYGGWRVEGPGEIRADTVIVALAPSAASAVVPPSVSDVLRTAVAAPVAVIGLGVPDLSLPDGFGALVGPTADVRILGALFESSYAPARAPEGHALIKVIVGGSADPEILELNDAGLVELACTEVGRMLGEAIHPTWTATIRNQGIPQYNLGHMSWLAKLDTALDQHPNLHVAGWGYRGIGLTSLADDAVLIADRIAQASS
ncbi:MAG: FAD-dependent oxidoreductase [Acidobacteria bacterium]|nr:FAD-dependent oxidoreductase [Acidobacteriota bacterium]